MRPPHVVNVSGWYLCPWHGQTCQMSDQCFCLNSPWAEEISNMSDMDWFDEWPDSLKKLLYFQLVQFIEIRITLNTPLSQLIPLVHELLPNFQNIASPSTVSIPSGHILGVCMAVLVTMTVFTPCSSLFPLASSQTIFFSLIHSYVSLSCVLVSAMGIKAISRETWSAWEKKIENLRELNQPQESLYL